MSISTGAAAVSRMASVSTRAVGRSRGARFLRRLLIVAAVGPVACAVGARRATTLRHAQRAQLADLQARLDDLEGPPDAMEKERIASHYELLANQLQLEQELAEVQARLAAIEARSPLTSSS